MDLYRAVDSLGNTMEFLLDPRRDAKAARRFFLKTLTATHTGEPRVINADKNAAYHLAFAALKAAGSIPEDCELRQSKYPNNLVEQAHRAHQTPDQVRDGLLARSRRRGEPVPGYETMKMRRSDPWHRKKRDSMKQVVFIDSLFGVAI